VCGAKVRGDDGAKVRSDGAGFEGARFEGAMFDGAA